LQPLVDRVTDPRVATYVEVHAGDADLTGAHVTFEVSASSQAGAIVGVRADVVSKDTHFGVARGVMPLDQLPPGRYIAYARVVVGGEERGFVTRPFTYEPR
ncbi:MAG: hypothetical protein ACT4QD_01945, partial [Acidobacteriota bacterium]